jgi:hypothetical protein
MRKEILQQIPTKFRGSLCNASKNPEKCINLRLDQKRT